MDLSELTAYAEEKYQIREQHKWADFPGFSVLTSPETGKWVALLMRQWDGETGTMLQRCDIKCGRSYTAGLHIPYVTEPARMKGQNWSGIVFDRRTEPEVVFRLFDRALRLEKEKVPAGRDPRGFTVVLDDGASGTGTAVAGTGTAAADDRSGKLYTDTLLPFRKGSIPARRDSMHSQGRLQRGQSGSPQVQPGSSQAQPGSSQAQPGLQKPRRIVHSGESPIDLLDRVLRSVVSGADIFQNPDVPEKILQMRALYEYGEGTFEEKRRNFYRQGKFMEDYEDTLLWTGEFMRYFPVYHDLNIRQLRGYFAWRTLVRKGEYRRVCTSFAYIYLYELLCGIGTDGPQDCLQKMEDFEKNYLDTGIGDPEIRENLHRWMLEYGVLHGLDEALVRKYADQDVMQKDHALAVLKSPAEYGDTEVFDALNITAAGGKLAESPVVKQDEDRGKSLFAQLWRYMTVFCRPGEQDLFTACFNEPHLFLWHPLSSAVYWEEPEKPGHQKESVFASAQDMHADADFTLNACRSFHCRDGEWKEKRYVPLFFDFGKLHAIVHEGDRALRSALKTGHYLRRKAGEEWVTPYVQAVLEEERRAIEEVARPVITIDLSGLDKIREDAELTRDSLLTEEEMAGAGENGLPAEKITGLGESGLPAENVTGIEENGLPVEAGLQKESAAKPELKTDLACGLDRIHLDILMALLHGEPVGSRIRDAHLMPAVVTDTINEALFDEIGDSVLECENDEIRIVEDYREDLVLLLGEA